MLASPHSTASLAEGPRPQGSQHTLPARNYELSDSSAQAPEGHEKTKDRTRVARSGEERTTVPAAKRVKVKKAIAAKAARVSAGKE